MASLFPSTGSHGDSDIGGGDKDNDNELKDKLTNEIIINHYKEHGMEGCIEIIEAARAATVSPTPLSTLRKSIVKSVERLWGKYRSLSKAKSRPEGMEKLSTFLNSDFEFPKQKCQNTKTDSVTSLCMPAIIHDANKLIYGFKAVADSIATDLSETREELTAAQEHEDLLMKENARISNTMEKVEKDKEKYKHETLSKSSEIKAMRETFFEQSKCIKEQEKSVKLLRQRNENVENKLKRKQCDLKATGSREDYHREKVRKLEGQLLEAKKAEEAHLESIEELHQQLLAKDDLIHQLYQERDLLKEENDTLKDEVIHTFDTDKKTFTPTIQKCVYTLQEHHVASKHVSPVIEAVLKMAGKKATRLPSISTVHNMNLQRLALSQKQLGDVLPKQEKTCLLSDETSKFGNKTCGYHIRNSEGKYYVLGLRDLVTKSGQDTLDALKGILQDIDKRCQDTASETSKHILGNIYNTMSDSASTEIKFCNLVEEFRGTILPYTVQNYARLSEEERVPVDKLLRFFCGLHSLVHMADVASTSIAEAEKAGAEPAVSGAEQCGKEGESGTARLVRTACKAFARGGDEKSGCHSMFAAFCQPFLKEHGFRTLPLVPYRGNRFNILFMNAGLVYFLQDKMVDFLQCHGLNRLTKSVLQDLKIPIYVSGVKALGLISKLITTPLWNLLEKQTMHVLDMNAHYQSLLDGLVDAANHVDEFMKGTKRPFGESVGIKEDSVYQKLTEASVYDEDCAAMLKVILPALAKYVQRKFKEHLPGGEFFEVTPELYNQTKSVPTHNKFSERVFAYTDQLLRFKPSINTLATEAYTMFCLNQTNQWLNSKTLEEQAKLVTEARKEVADLRKEYKARRAEIEKERWAILQEKRKKAEEQKQKKIKEKEDMASAICYWGLWQSPQQVEDKIKGLTRIKDKTEALKAQLRFRQNLLGQEGPRDVYKFTFIDANGKRAPVPWQDLMENVKTLVAASQTSPTSSSAASSFLVGKRVKHRFKENGDQVWHTGLVISQVSLVHSFFLVVFFGNSQE